MNRPPSRSTATPGVATTPKAARTAGTAKTRRRSGRRPGPAETRDAILTAARAEFGSRGFDGATIRAIAAGAGVDPALVMYFFGSKQQLFLESIELTLRPAEVLPRVLEGGLEGIGERLTRFYLGLWENPQTREAVAAIVRSAFSHEGAAEVIRGFLGSEVFGRVAEHLPGADPELRVELAGSHLVGLAIARHILRVEPLASADAEAVISRVAPTVQRYLTADFAAG
jgi:AcrR family transcriptional regulator